MSFSKAQAIMGSVAENLEASESALRKAIKAQRQLVKALEIDATTADPADQAIALEHYLGAAMTLEHLESLARFLSAEVDSAFSEMNGMIDDQNMAERIALDALVISRLG